MRPLAKLLWTFIVVVVVIVADTSIILIHESPLPLTDPRHAVAQRMLNIRIASYGNQTISSARRSR